ncbi:hypothetical protein J1N35_004397 [Gossypium stocksii]|uniref:Uncharacterized protein n=1 Tax=Gossypium stocksii TaxID=47602 RepID=A0A9D3WCP6_9ROSI|nr:hypothetical protein J1N35_004397 [Gossypium stocksii]
MACSSRVNAADTDVEDKETRRDVSYNELQGWIARMQEYVPGTVIDLQTLPYKGPDREIQSGKRIAFAIVGSECFESWEFFLRNLRRHIVKEDNICLISDRSKGLLATIRRSGVPWRQRFARLESQMSSLPTDFRTWLGSMENWQWTQSYDKGFRLATLMPKMGLGQAKQIEARHVYVEGFRKAMAVNSRRAQTMNVELYSHNLETFRVKEYIGYHSGLPPWSYAIDLRNRRSCARANINVEQFTDEIYTLQRTLHIWGNEFPVILDVSNWEVPLPAFEMVPDCSLCRHPKGRPQSTRIRNDMDSRRRASPNCVLRVKHPDTIDQHARIVSMFPVNRLIMSDSKMTNDILLSGQSSRNDINYAL